MRYVAITLLFMVPGSIPILLLYTGIRLLWILLTYSEEADND